MKVKTIKTIKSKKDKKNYTKKFDSSWNDKLFWVKLQKKTSK